MATLQTRGEPEFPTMQETLKPGSEKLTAESAGASTHRRPDDILHDQSLSLRQKKKALAALEQDAHQLLTASNEGMAPDDDSVLEAEPKLDDVIEAEEALGMRPSHKPSQ
ncbi:MAG: hypothetical protein U1E56_09055 [Bauldia sp.]